MQAVWHVMRNETEFRKLLTASFISGIGDWFNNVAVLSLLLQLTDSGTTVAITLALRTVPYLFMGPLAGILADKWDRKWILILSDLTRMGVALTFILVQTSSDVWISYVATFGLIMFSALFAPSRTALIPQLVKTEHLFIVNGLDQSTNGMVMAIGSLVGGVVTVLFGVKIAFVLNSISFLLSAILCMHLRIPEQQRMRTQVSGERDLKRLWSLLRESSLMRGMLLLEILWPLGGGMINVLLSVYAFQVFMAGNLGVGILYGALGIGFILGGLLTQYVSRWGTWVAIGGLLIEGLFQVGTSQAPHLWMAASCLLIATIGAGISNARLLSMVMQGTHECLHGRVFSLFNVTSSVVLSVSMLTTGGLLHDFAPRTLGIFGGVLIVLGALLAARMIINPRHTPGTARSF